MTLVINSFYWINVIVRGHGYVTYTMTIGQYRKHSDSCGDHFFWEIVGSDHMVPHGDVEPIAKIEMP